MSSSPILLHSVVAAASSYLLWKIARSFTSTHSFTNIPGPKPASWITGNFIELLHPKSRDYHFRIAEKFGGVIKIWTFFKSQDLYVFDPKALQHVLVKDVDSYDEIAAFYIMNGITFGNGILANGGQVHRKQRKMLNPVFSVAHLRRMVPVFNDVVRALRDTLVTKAKTGTDEVDLLAWTTRTALELIGRTGMGYSFDDLKEDEPTHPYTVSAKAFTPVFDTLAVYRFVVLPIVHNWGTSRIRRGIVDFLSMFWGNLRRGRDIVDIMDKTTLDIYHAKKNALEKGDQADALGSDIIDILMRANMVASKEDQLPEDQVIGQISSITFAAMDTTSNALARIFYMLSRNLDVQNKVRAEIREALEHNGGDDLEHDDLLNLPYLDAVCKETMRLFPPVPILLRQAIKDTVLPFSKPIIGVDGREMTEVHVPKGTNIFISALASNTNKELWGPDAQEWKPDRWMKLPEQLVNAKIPGVWAHLMTFLGGHRGCIGVRFSELEMKSVLAILIDRFSFEPSDTEIIWNMANIIQPAVEEKGELKNKLPMRIKLAA